MKRKVSATMEADAYELLSRAADSEGMSVSEMLERAVRLACSEYLPHAIDIAVLDNGGCSVTIAMRGETFYSYRACRRHAAASVRASVRIEPPGRLDVDKAVAALRAWQEQAAGTARSGKSISAVVDGITVQLADLPLRVESEPSFVPAVLQRAAEAIAAAEVTQFGQLARRRCPACSYFLVRLSVWSDPGDPRDQEEREWTCGVGHRTTVGPWEPTTDRRSAGPAPADGIAGPPLPDAAEAFADIGAWEGEPEVARLLAGARRRGGTRAVPRL